jgi:hypothetical protein
MIDKSAKKVIRTKHGSASFKYIEKFDSVKKAADPSSEGELVEVVVNEIKWDHTIVKEKTDGQQPRSNKDQGKSAENERPTEKEK